jgi:CxxC-x17-CxxC domain-containing protein
MKERSSGLEVDDRRRHMYVIGKTGMGKTAFLENMAIQDIQDGHGMCFIDPHGDAVERLLNFVPKDRINDVVYFNPSDLDFPISFNIMEDVSPERRQLVVGGLMETFKKIWPDVWSARMEYILNNALLALIEYPDATLLGVNRMLSDKEYRAKVVANVSDPMIKSYWEKEFSRYTERYEVEATAAIQNKIGQFLSSPLIRNIVGQVKSTINMRKLMDEKKIVLLNLSKGRIGEDNAKLLGALLVTKIQLAAMSRVDIPEETRKDFFLYVDEFQNFATRSFTNVLSEARKYRLSLILAHQYIEQMEEEVADAVFGNVGTIITFRIGAEDAEFLEKEFSPEFYGQDIVNLGKYNIYLKLMIDGVASRPFSALTIAPDPIPEEIYNEKIINASRERYAVARSVIEEKMIKWAGDISEAPVSGKKTPKLYDAVCNQCKKDTKVVFEPDGKRPVYCKDCLAKKKEGGDFHIESNKELAERLSKEPEKKEPVVEEKKEELAEENRESKVEEQKEKPKKTISLSDLKKKEPISFSRKKEPIKREKKEVNLKDLKETLKKHLNEK